MTEPDSELLRRFADERADAAIAELVRRHLDLVHAAALRQVGGDAHLAEEVAQDVFLDCARKAAVLRRRDCIVGWLYTSTHFAAAKRRRTERRRHAREEAYAMNESIARNASPDPDWSELRPILDAAMQELGERDRETVLLRYFERRSVAEVGRQLGLTENAAAKVIERALDRLRERIARRGISSAGGALAVLLGGQAVTAAPTALASTITTAIAAGGPAVSVGVASLFFMTKTSVTLVAAAALILASVTLNVRQHRRGVQVHAELTALKQQWVRTELAGHDERAALQAARRELQTLRAAAAARGVASQTTAAPPAAVAVPPARPGLAASAAPESKPFADRGRATPADLVETYMWATAQGDAKALAAATALSSEDTALVSEWFRELPETTRQQFGTPEIAVAAVILSFSMVSGREQGYVQILQQTEQGPDRLRVKVRTGGEGGFGDRDETLVRTPDGWKLLAPAGRLTPERKVQFQETANSIAAAVKR